MVMWIYLWTLWGWDKMEAIFQFIFMYKDCYILIQIPLKFIPDGPVDDNGLVPNRWQTIIWTQWSPSVLIQICIACPQWVYTLRLKQNGWHFADDIFKCTFLNCFWLKLHCTVILRVQIKLWSIIFFLFNTQLTSGGQDRQWVFQSNTTSSDYLHKHRSCWTIWLDPWILPFSKVMFVQILKI